MKMEEVLKELDELHAEMKMLKAECQIKTELSESLNKAHDEQSLKFQEAKLQIEKQTQELNAKAEEISQARKMFEDLKSRLHEKELSNRNLSSANEKLRSDCGEKLQKMEGENRELVLALDEAAGKNKELEQRLYASSERILRLKSLIMVSEKKCLEAEQIAQAPRELWQRDDVILKLEDDTRNIQDQLKWKTEQFNHLEEAHQRLQDRFQMSKEKLEREKSALVEEISSLQQSLDSQTRVAEGLQNQLDMCSHALAHEESRRKVLEAQVSEFKSHFENVFAQCQGEKLKIESSTVQRDEEIARLRNSLGKKEIVSKEMALKLAFLEQENQEMRESLIELQEAQIRTAGAASSLTKLRSKFRGLEQVHSNCSTNLKAKESELSFQIEKMKTDIGSYKSELKGKEKEIQELQMELETLHSTIYVLNEEIYLLFMVLKLELSEADLGLSNVAAEMEVCNKEKEDKISSLIKKLEINNTALIKAHLDLKQEHEKVLSLLKRVESLDLMEQQQILLAEELERHKKMLKESSECQLHLKQRVLQMENALNEDRGSILEVLEKAECELAEKVYEGNQLEFELQSWKSTAESLKICLGENQGICKQMETSCLAQDETEDTLIHNNESRLSISKEQQKSIGDCQQQIVTLESFTNDQENLIRISEGKDSCLENLQKDRTWLKQESIRRESECASSARLNAEKAFEQEKERLLHVLNEKDQSTKDLQGLVMSLEEDLTNAMILSSSELIEKQVEISVISEAVKNAEYLKKIEIEEKNKIIAGLEKQVSGLCEKLAYHKESLFHSKQEAEQLQALLETNKTETEKLMNQFGNEQRSIKDLVKMIEFEKEVLVQDTIKLSTEKEDIMVHVEEICDRLSEFSSEDLKLMNILEKILQSSKEAVKLSMDLKLSNELNDSTRNYASSSFSALIKKYEVDTDRRSPLKELNH